MRFPSSLARTALIAVAPFVALAATPATARAQMPGAPVLQNAFSNRGITVAGNYAGGDGTSLAAAALAWSPGGGRFQVSGGLGRLAFDGGGEDGDDLTGTAWGARLSAALLSLAGGRIGIAPFAGVGGFTHDDVSVLQIPAGVGAGWRMALGETRALSLYATGTYLWARTDVDDVRRDGGRIRAAAAVDVTVVRNLGLTVGYEAGGEAGDGEAGPTGSIFGVGLSWAFR
jgi:hypothetical protein